MVVIRLRHSSLGSGNVSIVQMPDSMTDLDKLNRKCRDSTNAVSSFVGQALSTHRYIIAYTNAAYRLVKKQIGSINISSGTMKYLRSIPPIVGITS